MMWRVNTVNLHVVQGSTVCIKSMDLLELTPQKDVLFIIGDWNAKVGSQETPGITGKLALDYGMKQDKG